MKPFKLKPFKPNHEGKGLYTHECEVLISRLIRENAIEEDIMDVLGESHLM